MSNKLKYAFLNSAEPRPEKASFAKFKQLPKAKSLAMIAAATLLASGFANSAQASNVFCTKFGLGFIALEKQLTLRSCAIPAGLPAISNLSDAVVYCGSFKKNVTATDKVLNTLRNALLKCEAPPYNNTNRNGSVITAPSSSPPVPRPPHSGP